MNTKSRDHRWRGSSIDSTRDNSIKTRVSSLAALTLIGIVAGVAAIKTHAKTNPTAYRAAAQALVQPGQPTLNFGSFGIAQGQVARINLVSLVQPREGDPPSEDRAELMFLGEDGKVLATQRVVVDAGQSASFQFSMDALGLTGNRLQLRAKVRFADPPGAADPPGESDPPGEHTIATVEVVDRSGRTSLMLPYFIKGADPPQPDLGQ